MIGNLSTSLTKSRLPTLAQPTLAQIERRSTNCSPRPALIPSTKPARLPRSLNWVKPASVVPPSTLLHSRRSPNQSHSLLSEPALSEVEWVRNRPHAPANRLRQIRALWPRRAGRALPGPAHRSPTRSHSPATARRLWQTSSAPAHNCMVGATRHTLNLFVVLVGESSKARKGTSWNQISQLLAQVDHTWTENRVTSARLTARGLIGILGREQAGDRRSPRARRGARLRAAHHGPEQVAALAPAALRLG